METFMKFVVIVGVLVGVCLLGAYPTMWITNYLFPESTLIAVFGIPALTFWKAFWLNFLCAGLFKSSASVNSK